jgi:hypothetical protein
VIWKAAPKPEPARPMRLAVDLFSDRQTDEA